VFVDIEPDTLQIEPDQIVKAITRPGDKDLRILPLPKGFECLMPGVSSRSTCSPACIMKDHCSGSPKGLFVIEDGGPVVRADTGRKECSLAMWPLHHFSRQAARLLWRRRQLFTVTTHSLIS
jgi:hypothetical protein